MVVISQEPQFLTRHFGGFWVHFPLMRNQPVEQAAHFWGVAATSTHLAHPFISQTLGSQCMTLPFFLSLNILEHLPQD
jgi:hypothetical protein